MDVKELVKGLMNKSAPMRAVLSYQSSVDMANRAFEDNAINSLRFVEKECGKAGLMDYDIVVVTNDDEPPFLKSYRFSHGDGFQHFVHAIFIVDGSIINTLETDNSLNKFLLGVVNFLKKSDPTIGKYSSIDNFLSKHNIMLTDIVSL